MGRVLGVDYGVKRTGLAVTDILKIAVNGLETVSTFELEAWLKAYLKNEDVEIVVFGLTKHPDGNELYFQKNILKLVKKLECEFTTIKFDFYDEAGSSVKAKSAIFNAGVKKSKRRDKALIDRMAAMIILQEYLQHT